MNIIFKGYAKESSAIKYANELYAKHNIITTVEFHGGIYMVVSV